MKRFVAIILFTTIATNLFSSENTPVPYENDEFNPILLDVRRASIIFCGAFPLGYMYSSVIGDQILVRSDPFSDIDDDVEKNNKEIEVKLVSSLIFASVVMIIDFIIEKFFKG